MFHKLNKPKCDTHTHVIQAAGEQDLPNKLQPSARSNALWASTIYNKNSNEKNGKQRACLLRVCVCRQVNSKVNNESQSKAQHRKSEQPKK